MGGSTAGRQRTPRRHGVRRHRERAHSVQRGDRLGRRAARLQPRWRKLGARHVARPLVRRKTEAGRLARLGARHEYSITAAAVSSIRRSPSDIPGVDTNAITDYRRELDLDRAVVTTRFRAGGTTYTREVFASYPAGVIVVRLSADRPGRVNVAAVPTSAHAGAVRRAVDANTIAMAGGVARGAIRFEARLVTRAEGGRTTIGDTIVTVTGANAVTFILAGATNYVSYRDVSADPSARNVATLGRIRATTYTRFLSDHLA